MLLNQIQTDLKNAQLARDEIKVSTLRLLLSEIHNAEIDKGRELSDQDVILLIQREVKKRNEAAVAFRLGNREEAALKEEAELAVLENYLPAKISNEELVRIVEDAIKEAGASTMADMGKVMAVVMGKAKGRADGGMVSNIAREKLSRQS